MFKLTAQSEQPQSALPVFENSTDTCFVYTTRVLGQPAELSKEACLYASADWLNSSVGGGGGARGQQQEMY